MELGDVYRVMLFVLFAVGSAFMVGTNILGFFVLRPPKKLGFLWWHVTAISLSFFLIGLVALSLVYERLNDPHASDLTWESIFLGIGFSLFALAQVIIFQVEKSRYVHKKALHDERIPINPSDIPGDE